MAEERHTECACYFPDRMDGPGILTFFDTFALTEKAPDHANGGLLPPLPLPCPPVLAYPPGQPAPEAAA